jgi:hypothetical protein
MYILILDATLRRSTATVPGRMRSTDGSSRCIQMSFFHAEASRATDTKIGRVRQDTCFENKEDSGGDGTGSQYFQS